MKINKAVRALFQGRLSNKTRSHIFKEIQALKENDPEFLPRIASDDNFLF